MTWPWQRAARERDREDEMRAHLELYIEELVGRGWTEADAAREARLRFGNPRAKLEAVADAQRLPLIETFWRDARYAVRVLRRTPAFTTTRSPRWHWSSAPRPPCSAWRMRCCGGRCRIRSPIVWR